MKSFWEAVCDAHQQYRPKNVNQWTADLGWQKAASGTSCHPFDIVFQVGLNGGSPKHLITTSQSLFPL